MVGPACQVHAGQAGAAHTEPHLERVCRRQGPGLPCAFRERASRQAPVQASARARLLRQVGKLRERGPVLLDARDGHVGAARGQEEAAAVEGDRRTRRAGRQVQRAEILQLAQVLRAARRG